MFQVVQCSRKTHSASSHLNMLRIYHLCSERSHLSTCYTEPPPRAHILRRTSHSSPHLNTLYNLMGKQRNSLPLKMFPLGTFRSHFGLPSERSLPYNFCTAHLRIRSNYQGICTCTRCQSTRSWLNTVGKSLLPNTSHT